MSRNQHVALLTTALAGAVLAASFVGDAQQAPPSRAAGTVNAGVTAVLVDVVVRDKHGMPVRDLQPADFEVLEDGVPQTVGSFKGIFDDTPAPGAAAETAPPEAPTPYAIAGPRSDPMAPPVTALVFDRLSPEAQGLAVHAAKSYFGGNNKKEAPTFVGVFSIEGSLRSVTPFTRSVEQIEKGLDEMQKRGSASFGIDREHKARVAQQAESSQQTADAAIGAAGRGGTQGIGSSPAAAALAQMESQMLTKFEELERDEQGYSQVNSLFAIIEALRPLPGRKSVVLFSEGVAIPPAVLRLFTGVIDAANRANVSIYTMDAAGLRVDSEQRKIADQVNEAAKRGLSSYASSSRGSGNEPLTKASERNEDALRQDPHTGLGELAQDTGGQLFENTNNLRTGFERLESDLRNYYLLGYTPANATYDGKFRTIEVRVKRPGVTVAARKGYFAVRDTGGAPVNTWEAPALGALDQKPVPNAFPFRAAALSFPSKDRPGVVPVVVHLKTAPMSFPLTADEKSFQSDFAIVVRFLDPQGRVARKVSQHYEMSGEAARLPIAQNSDVLFYREPVLPPGVYTMETIVYDNPSKKASVRYSTVEVPTIDPKKLRISSLVVVDRGEHVGADEPKDSPLFVKDVLIYPNLTGEVSKSAKELGFFFTVYPGTTTPAPEAVLDVIQNGTRLAQLPIPLDAADGSGRIQQVGRLPLDAFAPGTYELRAIVKQGADQVYSSVMIKVSE